MKNLITKIMLISGILSLLGCRSTNDPAAWSDAKTEEWFRKGEWLNGWAVTPDNSIDKKALAAAVFKNKERWNSAFTFLKNNDLAALETKRYDIDGDNIYVSVSEYNTKDEEKARYEAHRKYIDIQYVVRGLEKIGVAAITSRDTTLQEYDGTKDIEFMRVKDGKIFPATPGNFFIFFPADAHMPGLKVDSTASVKKIVVKIRID